MALAEKARRPTRETTRSPVRFFLAESVEKTT
jgi:hypothetical protein